MSNTTKTVNLSMAGLDVRWVVSPNASQSAGLVTISLTVKIVVTKEVFVVMLVISPHCYFQSLT